LISFGLGESPLSPLTLRETRINDFSIIHESVSSGWLADRSKGLVGVPRRGLLVAFVRPLVCAGGSGTV
jgi:hypothetical protein